MRRINDTNRMWVVKIYGEEEMLFEITDASWLPSVGDAVLWENEPRIVTTMVFAVEHAEIYVYTKGGGE